jgi:hypothetical protein
MTWIFKLIINLKKIYFFFFKDSTINVNTLNIENSLKFFLNSSVIAKLKKSNYKMFYDFNIVTL